MTNKNNTAAANNTTTNNLIEIRRRYEIALKALERLQDECEKCEIESIKHAMFLPGVRLAKEDILTCFPQQWRK